MKQKQSAEFVKKIISKGISMDEYFYIICKIHDPEYQYPNAEAVNQSLVDRGFLSSTGELTEKSAFLGIKSRKSDDLVSKTANEVYNIFPDKLNKSGHHARSGIKEIEARLIWFFKEYNYSVEEILDACRAYVDHDPNEDRTYKQTAGYFICKTKDGVKTSALAAWCEGLKKKTDEFETSV